MMLSVDFFYLFIFILLNEAITNFIVKSELLFNIRETLINQNSFIGKALNCGYCFSFWSAIILTSIYFIGTNGKLLINFDFFIFSIFPFNVIFTIIKLIFNVFCLQRLSNYLHGFSDRFFDTQKDNRFKDI